MESKPKMRCSWRQIQNSQMHCSLTMYSLSIFTGSKEREGESPTYLSERSEARILPFCPSSFLWGWQQYMTDFRQSSSVWNSCFPCILQWPVTEVEIHVSEPTPEHAVLYLFCNLARGFHSILGAIYNPEQLPHGKGMSHHQTVSGWSRFHCFLKYGSWSSISTTWETCQKCSLGLHLVPTELEVYQETQVICLNIKI